MTLAERLTLMVVWVRWLRARGFTPAETLALVRLRNRVAGGRA